MTILVDIVVIGENQIIWMFIISFPSGKVDQILRII